MGWYTKSERTSHDHRNLGNRHRSVCWPEGAPCPKDVPHAGALVRVDGHRDQQYCVLSGIPYRDKLGWRLQVQHIMDEYTMCPRLIWIHPWYGDDEPCYTEAQVREALDNTCTVQDVIDKLKGRRTKNV